MKFHRIVKKMNWRKHQMKPVTRLMKIEQRRWEKLASEKEKRK
jgi:hypothetical protein